MLHGISGDFRAAEVGDKLAAMQEESTTRRARVLAVDDSPVMRILVSEALEARGFSVKAVDSGFAALEACAEESFDVVVLDVEMPGGMDGLAVGRSLRESLRNSGAMIAMHTGLQEEVVRNGFVDYDAFIAKPCDASQLGARVQLLLTGAGSTRQAR